MRELEELGLGKVKKIERTVLFYKAISTSVEAEQLAVALCRITPDEYTGTPFFARMQPKEKVYDSPQRFGYILALPTSTYLICPTSPPLSEHHECGVVVYGFGGAKQSTKISIRCQSCRNIYNYTTFGNAGYGWKLYGEPGIALRPAT
ncbi:hypothetical protein OS493_017262 [Desmophyllum pertusum]|uniref:Uncharacterized protein n=1 Tax=Desmophyllum pertusum TaxID=174260 RepID=A0A9X0A156_9CNID|nr:hypothetical protein OS493_017262 [Desmophyllum pertusum]